ncbi:MAG TPA: hypothetical protein PKY87_13130 [Terricaulis sp.]|nr:hypothetical protein [Terricaulis sp.]
MGPWDVMCRADNGLEFLFESTANQPQFAQRVNAPWRARAEFRRAPAGYEQRPLEPGECALANAPLRGQARTIYLFRLMEGVSARQPEALARFTLRARYDAVSISGPDPVLRQFAYHAGSVVSYARAFHMRVEPCAGRCEWSEAENHFYVTQVRR